MVAENTPTTKKRSMVRSSLCIAGDGLSADEVQAIAAGNPREFMAKAQQAIEAGHLRWDKIGDLRRFFNSTFDIEVPVEFDVAGKKRSIMSSAFPLLAGNMTIAGINDAYDTVDTIGQELVTDIESNKRVSIHAAVTSLDVKKDEVKETEDFPEIGASEEKYEIRNKRNGRMMTVSLDTIEENDPYHIVEMTNSLQEIAGEHIEDLTLQRVCDLFGSAGTPAEPYVLRPGGAGSPLYRATANTPGPRATSGTRVNSNALSDETNLDAARAVLTAMRNSNGRHISIPMASCVLLVPEALYGTALKILNSELTPGTENELNNWGPRGAFRPKLLSSPKLDDISPTTWYLGNFRKQFKRKWKIKFEYVTLGMNTESFLKRRIAFQARIAWDVEVGATDYVYVVQNLSGTAAPTPS